MTPSSQARHLAAVVAPLVSDAVRLDEPPDARWIEVLRLDDDLAAVAVLYELRRLAGTLGMSAAVGHGSGGPSPPMPPDLQERLERALAEDEGSRAFLWSVLNSDRPAAPALRLKGAGVQRDAGESGGAPRVLTARVSRQIIAALLNGVIAVVLLVAFVYRFGWDPAAWWDIGLLKLFAIWAMSFLPGWLFIRFLGQRAQALWWDFVLALHRLGVDRRQHLPEPPLNSEYYALWRAAGGSPLRHASTIYQEKFDAYYGKSISRMGSQQQTTKIWSETLFPVILLTAVLAAAWTAVLWDTSFAQSPSGAVDLQKFGFLGAYSFIVQMLIRRFFQSDLRASAYATAVVRIFAVAILVTVVAQLPVLRGDPRTAAVVAFVVGFFPLVGMQALQRLAATVLRQVVPSLNPAYPLNQIDGLNVWYEARLLEEGIEDMQNLTTTNLVDVILHTHVPVGRLVDWIDQAYLYQHLDRTELSRKERRQARRASAESGRDGAVEARDGFRPGTKERHLLRSIGVRTATDLLCLLPNPLSKEDCRWLDTHELDSFRLSKLVAALDKEPGLDLVRRWQADARFEPDTLPGSDLALAG